MKNKNTYNPYSTKTNFAKAVCIFMSAMFASLSFAQESQPNLAEAKEANTHDCWTERESLFLESLIEENLPDSGFTPTLSWAGEQWTNVSGGLKRGTTWDSLLTFGFEQDLGKLAKVDGLGRIGMTAFHYTGSGDFSGEYVGSMSDPSNIFSGEMVRVFEIYYANEFETSIGTFSTRIGQLAADEDFMGIDYADIFLNSSLGAIPVNAGTGLYSGVNAFSQYSLATLGLTVGYEVDDFDFMLGIYNGNAGDDLSKNHGFNYDFEGVAVWYQIGYNYELFGRNGRVQFGGNYNSAKFENFATGDTGRNFYSFYLGIQQDILVDDEKNPILGAFCRLAWAPDSDISAFTKYVDFGFNWFGPIPCRGDDVFAVAVSILEAGKAFSNAEGIDRNETMVEATYKLQLTKAISLQPVMQVYLNPRNSFDEKETAFVVGTRLEVNF